MLAINTSAATASTRAIEARLTKMAAALGETWECIVAIPDAVALRLRVFEAGRSPHQPARPFLAFNELAADEVAAVVRQRFVADVIQNERDPSMLAVMTVGANAARQVWVRRLSTNGADLGFAPLSPRYALWKHHKGLDPRTGVATGLMLNSIARGRIIVRKIR